MLPGNNSSTVLVVNCGSSSIKYQLLAMGEGAILAGGVLERIGEGQSRLRHRAKDSSGKFGEHLSEVCANDHREAFHRIAEAMRASGLLTGADGMAVIGHRVVHGGESFSAPVLIDRSVVEEIRALVPLAPLHNPANLVGIEICLNAFPTVPQVAVFDTAFHQTMPPHAFRYAVPEDWYGRYAVRRYGFHGSSHRYVALRAAAFLGRSLATLNLISLHLGNGASAAAVAKGRCVDTSMGFTPLEGLVMGSRCGDLDAAVPLHIQHSAGLSAAEVGRALNQQSGLRGLCGSNDLREVLASVASGDGRAQLALDLFVYRIKKYIGAYCAVLGAVDAVVFTGGIGENSPEVRGLACAGLERLGIGVDANANASNAAVGDVCEIGQPGMQVRLLVIRTNEELQIAREAWDMVYGAGNV